MNWAVKKASHRQDIGKFHLTNLYSGIHPVIRGFVNPNLFFFKVKGLFFLPSLKMKNKLPSNEGRCRGYVWKPEVQDVVDTSDVLPQATPFKEKKRYTSLKIDLDLLKMLGNSIFFNKSPTNGGFSW